MPGAARAKLSIVAEFPAGYFLENLAVRANGAILVTAMNRKELWLVPPPASGERVTPQLLHTFDLMTMFIVEFEPDIFLLGTADIYGSGEAALHRIDLRDWRPDHPLVPACIMTFPEPHMGLNGGCLVAPRVLLAAGVARLIWRVDLAAGASAGTARVWLQHDSMNNRPGEKKPEQPGVNGVRYAARTHALYYTSTSRQLMLRVRVDPHSLEPADLPEFIAGGREWDDFVIDEAADIAYVTTHRENTIDRVRLQPDGNREGFSPIAGDPLDELLIGPSSAAWGRAPGQLGRVAYVTTDGGAASPPDGARRSAKLLRVELPPVDHKLR